MQHASACQKQHFFLIVPFVLVDFENEKPFYFSITVVLHIGWISFPWIAMPLLNLQCHRTL